MSVGYLPSWRFEDMLDRDSKVEEGKQKREVRRTKPAWDTRAGEEGKRQREEERGRRKIYTWKERGSLVLEGDARAQHVLGAHGPHFGLLREIQRCDVVRVGV